MALTLTKGQEADRESMTQSRLDWERDTARLADDVQTWAGLEEAARG